MSGITYATANAGACGGRECGAFIEQMTVLEAVVELAQHPVEQIALASGVPVSVVVTSPPVVGFGTGRGSDR